MIVARSLRAGQRSTRRREQRLRRMPPDPGEPGLRLGYACLNTLFGSPARTTRLANATPERLRELLAANLDTLEAILRWNDANDIRVFRLSSNTVPPCRTARELSVARSTWRAVRRAAGPRGAGMRLSTHPGPYTVPASADEAIADAAIREPDQTRNPRALRLDRSPKSCSISGGAGDRQSWLDRFGQARAPRAGNRSRLVLENDERWSFNGRPPGRGRAEPAGRVRRLSSRGEQVDSPSSSARARRARGETWHEGDGRQEVHFSTQAPGRRAGAHADTLDLRRFRRFAEQVGRDPAPDCVLEVKDNEQSVLRARRDPARGDRSGPPGLEAGRATAGAARRTGSHPPSMTNDAVRGGDIGLDDAGGVDANRVGARPQADGVTVQGLGGAHRRDVARASLALDHVVDRTARSISSSARASRVSCGRLRTPRRSGRRPRTGPRRRRSRPGRRDSAGGERGEVPCCGGRLDDVALHLGRRHRGLVETGPGPPSRCRRSRRRRGRRWRGPTAAKLRSGRRVVCFVLHCSPPVEGSSNVGGESRTTQGRLSAGVCV